jgi:acyl-coenzyme A thioesterase PaaI-like protein
MYIIYKVLLMFKNNTEIDLKEFKAKTLNTTSLFFRENFENLIKNNFKIEKLSKKNFIIKCEVRFDERHGNSMKILHGGAQSAFLENFIKCVLFYLTDQRYRCIDFDMNFQNKSDINKNTYIIYKINRAGDNICFVNSEVLQDEIILTRTNYTLKKETAAKF